MSLIKRHLYKDCACFGGMTFAFGHLIGAWVLGKIYEKVKSKKLSHLTWGFLLLGGILPDADFVIDWVIGTNLHRTFSHSLLFVLVAGLVVYVIGKYFTKENKEIGVAIAAGVLMHLFLDYFSVLGIALFWPYPLYFSPFENMYQPVLKGLTFGTLQELKMAVRLAVVDMAFGTVWIGYLWFKKRIQF